MFCFFTRPKQFACTTKRSSAVLTAALFPLFLASCGDTDLASAYEPDNLEAKNIATQNSTDPVADNLAAQEVDGSSNGGSDNTASAGGKDQVGTSAATGSASKLTDTTPAVPPSNTPTEKVDDDNSNADNNAIAESVNSIDTIVNDMALLNDAPLVGIDPSLGFASGPGFNVMGNQPRDSALPAWYLTEFPQLADSGAWNALLPWFVVFEGEGNQAVNTRVQMRNLKVFILSRESDTWQQVIGAERVDGDFCSTQDSAAPCTALSGDNTEADGGVSLMPQSGSSFHGSFGARTQINGPDVMAVFVTMQSRLIAGEAGTDDRDQARLLIDVGADYYPTVDSDLPYVPGVGVSRAKLLSNEWQSFNFMTFSDVGNQAPGGGVTESQFRSNPPPLD